MEKKVIKKTIVEIMEPRRYRVNIDYLVYEILRRHNVRPEAWKDEAAQVRHYILASKKLAIFSGKNGGVELLPTGTTVYKGKVR